MTTVEPRARTRHDARQQKAIDHYNELLLAHYLEGTIDAAAKAVDFHDVRGFPGQSTAILLRPYIAEKRRYREALYVAAVVNRGILTAAGHLLRNAAARAALGLPEYLESIIELDCGRAGWPLIARIDGVVDERNTFNVLEYNSEPRGMSEYAEMTWAFAALPIAQAFGGRYPFRYDSLFDLTLRALHLEHHARGRPGVPAIGVVQASSRLTQDGSLKHIVYAAARGCHIHMARAEEFDFHRGRLTVDGTTIDSVIFANWDEVFLRREASTDLFDAIRGGAITVVNGLSGGLLCSYKHTLEMLSDDDAYGALFDQEVRRVARAHVPWTRVVRPRKTRYGREVVDLLPFAASHRDGFVLKPSGGSGGRGVIVGSRCDQSEWVNALEAGSHTHVVQEQVVVPRQPYPVLRGGAVALEDLVADYCPFVWNGASVAGCQSRASPSLVTNRSCGGSPSAFWILT